VLCLPEVAEPVRQSAETLAQELGGVMMRVLPADRAGEAGAGDLVDLEGKLAAWLARYDADSVVLRPDRYVFGASRGSAIEKLREQVRPFIHRPEAGKPEESSPRVSLTSSA
jgi:3-(3-hydroxy-phenyl)propionate hydroxylase